MSHKFFYSWQSDRPESTGRYFVRAILEKVSGMLNQSGIEERIEVDSDTKGVPGTPEIFSTILTKIENTSVFIADLTICAESASGDRLRLFPNSNVMFEYGYALKAKGRSRLLCVMNTFYGGDDPTLLPFDLRHARGPIRYQLSPSADSATKKKVAEELGAELLTAARLIVENLPGEHTERPALSFEKPHFSEGDEVTPEGDFSGQVDPTYFGKSSGFVYLKARSIKPMALTPAEIKKRETATAALEISSASNAGSFGTNKWGRVGYAVESKNGRRTTRDYVQYFRSGEIEIVNGSYLAVIKSNPVNADYLLEIIKKMIKCAKDWIEKCGGSKWQIEIGVLGVERRRMAWTEYGNRPLIHQNKIFCQKLVDKDSVSLLADEFQAALVAEVAT